jgi:hypothetical protein
MPGLCCFSAQGHRGGGLLILDPILRKAPLLKRVASQIFRPGLFSDSPNSAVFCLGTNLVNLPKMSDFGVRHAVRVGGGRSRFDL